MNVYTDFRVRGFLHCDYIDSRLLPTVFTQFHQDSTSLLSTNMKTINKNPDWRKAVAKRVDASSPYELRKHEYYHHWSSASGYLPMSGYYQKSINHIDRGFVDLTGQIQSGDDLVLRDQALIGLKRKLAKQTSQMSLLVPLAEIGEMRGLIRSLATSGMDLVKALIEIKRTRGLSAAKFASDKWLTWSFGIAPTLSDIDSLSKAIEAYLTDPDRNVRLASSASKTWRSVYNQPYLAPKGTNAVLSCDITHRLSYRMVASFDLQLRSGNAYGINNQFGLNLGDLPSVGWELLPFSWLADYFTTTGAYLDDAFYTPPGVTKYVIQNKRYELTTPIHVEYTDAKPGFVISQECKDGFYRYLLFNRTPLSSLPHVGLHFKSLDQVGVNAVNRLLNLSSLLVQGISPDAWRSRKL